MSRMKDVLNSFNNVSCYWLFKDVTKCKRPLFFMIHFSLTLR